VYGHKCIIVKLNNFVFKYFIEESQKRFDSYQIFFDNDEKFNRIDESKRIDKNRFNSTDYGLEGSFKKLELD